MGLDEAVGTYSSLEITLYEIFHYFLFRHLRQGIFFIVGYVDVVNYDLTYMSQYSKFIGPFYMLCKCKNYIIRVLYTESIVS